MSKLLVVVGATSKQGGSVIDEFLKDPAYRIRGITRNPASPAGQSLVARGVEVVAGDLLNLDSLKLAFKGANVIFAMTTDFNANLATVGPDTPSKSALEKSYDLELQQGRNITQAALSIIYSSLDVLIFSTLAAVKRISKGKYSNVLHFDAKGDVIDEMKDKYPELARKTKAVILGFFMSNWKQPTPLHPTKQSDGSYEIASVGSGDSPQPFVVPDKDMAIFAHALAKQPLGNKMEVYFSYGDLLSFNQYAALLSKILGVSVHYRELTIEEYVERMKKAPIKGLGLAVAEMYAFSAEFGYDGGEPEVIPIRNIPLSRPPISLEEFFKQEDLSSVIS